MKSSFYILFFIQLVTFQVFHPSSFEAVRQELRLLKAHKMVIQVQQPGAHMADVTFYTNQIASITTQVRSKFLSLLAHIPHEQTRQEIESVLQGNHPARSVEITETHIGSKNWATYHTHQHSYPEGYKPVDCKGK